MLRVCLLVTLLMPTAALAAGGRYSGPKVMVMREGKLIRLSGKARRAHQERDRKPLTLRRNTKATRPQARPLQVVLSPRMRLAISRWPSNARGRFLRRRQLSSAKREMELAATGGTPLEQASARTLYETLVAEAR